MKDAANTSVLVIDDEEIVRNNIEEILIPKKKSAESLSLDLAASILFDSASGLDAQTPDQQHSEFHGRQGRQRDGGPGAGQKIHSCRPAPMR